MFPNYLGVIQAIAQLGDGATAGAIQKMNPHMTIGQVKRLLKSLIADGYVVANKYAHGRTGKYCHYLSDICVVNIRSVARDARNAPAIEVEKR